MTNIKLRVVLGFLLCAPLVLVAQNGTIQGNVTDARTAEALPGANVVVQELLLGAATNLDGHFTIAGVPVGARMLEVRFVGYRTMIQEVTVSMGQTVTVNYQLAEDVLLLDEIIITGTAGGARKREIGNSIAVLDIAKIQEPVGSVDNLLMGRVAGLNVQFATGHPGSGGIIRLRGNNSVAMSNAPLIYIDGVRVRADAYPNNVPPVGFSGRSSGSITSPLNDINPNDIERIEVIKGASATTLYGTEAAGGVIQIFTKKGQMGQPVWTAQIDQGFDRMLEYGSDQRPYMGLDPFIDLGYRSRYLLSVGGGGAGMRYYISGLYNDQEGVLPNSEQQQVQVRGNFGFSPLDKMQVNVTASFSNSDVQNPPGGNNAHGLTLNALRGRASYFGDDWESPDFVSNLERLLEYEITTEIERLLTGAEVIFKAIPNFIHKFNVGFDRSAIELRNIRRFGFVRAQDGILSVENWTGETLTLEYNASYNWRLSEDFRTSVTVTEIQKTSTLAGGNSDPSRNVPLLRTKTFSDRTLKQK